MRVSKDKLNLRRPEEIATTKLRDEMVRLKEIKYDALCPMFAFYYPCSNLILKNYCPFVHNEDCRKGYAMQMNQIEEGTQPDYEAIYEIVAQNAITDDERLYRKNLFRKYPTHPDD